MASVFVSCCQRPCVKTGKLSIYFDRMMRFVFIFEGISFRLKARDLFGVSTRCWLIAQHGSFLQEGANSDVEQYHTAVIGRGARRGSSDAKQQNKQSG